VRVPVLVLLLLTGCTSTGYASLDGATLDEQDGRRLTVQGVHGACDTLQRPEVDQDDDRVRVTVPLRLESGGCDDLGLPVDVSVRLDEPLGDRPVLDARSGRALEVVGRDRCRPLTQPQQLDQYLGATEEQVRARAQADGYRAVRVTCRDGRGLDITSDRRSDRVSLTVDDGRVSGAAAF